MIFNRFKDDMFAHHFQAIINTVNCDGIMGGGLALQFKTRFPEMFTQYEKDCKLGIVRVGKMHIFEYDPDKYIINFPTKNHVQYDSQYSYVEDGLKDLGKLILTLKIKSIAIPPLGCGLGGLDWVKVKPMIVKFFKDPKYDDVNIIIFNP